MSSRNARGETERRRCRVWRALRLRGNEKGIKLESEAATSHANRSLSDFILSVIRPSWRLFYQR